MKFLLMVSLLIFPILLTANPIERENLSPTVKEPLIPGTKVPLREMNSAPTPIPSANRSDYFRQTLKGTKRVEPDYIQAEEAKPKNNKRRNK